MKPTLRLINGDGTIQSMKSNVLQMPLPGNPRSWGIEAKFVPADLDQADWLTEQLVDAGVSFTKAWGIVGWIRAKAKDGKDPSSLPTRSEYRKVLEALPVAPWEPRPLGKGTRRTSQAIAREAGRASCRSMAMGGALLSSPALSAAGVHWGIQAALYITMIMGVSKKGLREWPAAYQRFCRFDEPTYGVLVILERWRPCQISLDITHGASQHVRIVAHGVKFGAGHNQFAVG